MKEKELPETEEKENPYNFSTACLLPMLGINWNWYMYNLINFYLGDRNRPEYDNNILCLVRYDSTEISVYLDRLLRLHTNFITDYDINAETIMYVFSIPEEYKEDYLLFKKGKYSLLSQSLKEDIIRNFPSVRTYHVLTRNIERKRAMEKWYDVELDENAELLDPPNPKREIYNYSE